MNLDVQTVVYWDASAVLSALFKDSRSAEAMKWSQKEAVHLISTLSYAEVCAVISRLKKERVLADVLVDAAFEALERGPWRRLYICPEWAEVKALSRKQPLRGADLWHLAMGKTIQKQIPELTLLTFDKRLQTAAKKEHLIR
ncbi:MAG: type II toxin-antitoxin system VapC family toxin [Candidatus Aminicenantes bacterium]|nr:MAG: type II toxin-antitoxin system VapC family toxin [Candidatus Aminicenantes bacterium]